MSCGGCGGPHPFDTSVPSVLWNQVIRSRGLSEYLCTTCIVKAFAEAGVSFTAQLWNAELGFYGVPIEVRIGGAVAESAARLNEEKSELRGSLSRIMDDARTILDKVTAASPLPQPERSGICEVRGLPAAAHVIPDGETACKVCGEPARCPSISPNGKEK